MIKIENNIIGKNNPCFIVFEIGPTHNGVNSAKNLIKKAKIAGANAVKFQVVNADRLVADKKQIFEYRILKNKKDNIFITKKESLYKILKRRELKNSELEYLRDYCKKLKIGFFATVCFDDEVDFLEKIGCNSIKIASADLNHFPLLEKVAKTNMSIQIDTGMATIEEIKKATKVISKHSDRIIIHHCPTGYPAKIEDVNLNIIKSLKNNFSYPIAFSDHSPGYDVDIAALSFGVDLLEKTITENRMTKSVEHAMSLEFKDMIKFVKTIRSIERCFGSSKKILTKSEIQKRSMIRRGIFLSNNVKKGQKLKDVSVEFRRPGDGLSVEFFELYKNRKFKKKLNKNTKLQYSHFIR